MRYVHLLCLFPLLTAQVKMRNESSYLGTAHTLNCIGEGVTCSVSGGEARFTISGGGGGGGEATDLTCTECVQSDEIEEVAASKVTGTVSSATTATTASSATTANALAANPSDCASDQFAHTIAASGNLTCSQVAYSQVSGTPTLRYQTVQDEDSDLTQRAKLNLEGAGVTCADDTDKTTCTIPGGGTDTNAWMDATNHRRLMQCQPIAYGGTSFGCNGPTAISMTGTGALLRGLNRYYINYPTLTTANNATGAVSTSPRQSTPNARPRLMVNFYVDAANNRRMWFGLYAGSTNLTLVAPITSQAASTIRHVGIVFDTAVSSSEFHCCSGDGTDRNCTAMGLTAANTTEYTAIVDFSVAGTLTCKVKPWGGSWTTATRTTLLPAGGSTSATDLAIQASTTILAGGGANENFHVSSIELEQN